MNDHNTLHKPQYQEVLGLWQHDANKFAHKHEEWQYWCSHLISELDSLLKGKLNNYLIININNNINIFCFFFLEGIVYQQGQFYKTSQLLPGFYNYLKVILI